MPDDELDKALDVDWMTKGGLGQVTTAGKDNLTRDEAQERAGARRRRVTYDIALDLRTGDVTFGSQTTVRFSCSAARRLDVHRPRRRRGAPRSLLNGPALDVTETPDARIALPDY